MTRSIFGSLTSSERLELSTTMSNQIRNLSEKPTSLSIESVAKLGKVTKAHTKDVQKILSLPLGILKVDMKFPEVMSKSLQTSLKKTLGTMRIFSPLFPGIKKEKVCKSIVTIAALLDVNPIILAKRILVSLHDPVFLLAYGREPLNLHSLIVSSAQTLRFGTGNEDSMSTDS